HVPLHLASTITTSMASLSLRSRVPNCTSYQSYQPDTLAKLDGLAYIDIYFRDLLKTDLKKQSCHKSCKIVSSLRSIGYVALSMEQYIFMYWVEITEGASLLSPVLLACTRLDRAGFPTCCTFSEHKYSLVETATRKNGPNTNTHVSRVIYSELGNVYSWVNILRDFYFRVYRSS
ncbi:hypothetical protein ACJX0J_011365, partial [Zea mays]